MKKVKLFELVTDNADIGGSNNVEDQALDKRLKEVDKIIANLIKSPRYHGSYGEMRSRRLQYYLSAKMHLELKRLELSFEKPQ